MPSNNLMKLKLFPEDMIEEILVRLPPKSVLRFRCLSRSHCSKLDGGEFIKQHLSHTLKSDPYETLIINEAGQEVQLLEHSVATPKVRRLTLPFDPARHPKCHSGPCPIVRICGSCHGLIALHICCSDLVVWNPYTNKHKRLTAPETEILRLMALGFGYDSLTEDYKLVWIDSIPYFPDPEKPSEYKVMVYSFKSNTWRKVSGLATTFYVMHGRGVALFREVLHFRSFKLDFSGEECVLAFNLRTEEFRALTRLPPEDEGMFRDVKVHLCVVFSLEGTCEIEVWAMTDYGEKDESWTKLFRISLLYLGVFYGDLLDYLETGRKFLFHMKHGGPVWVDLERRTIEKVPREIQPQTDFSCRLEATLMAGTLVSSSEAN